MYTFHELKKAAKKNNTEADNKTKIAILGNSATQFFATAIKGYANLENLPVENRNSLRNSELVDIKEVMRQYIWN